jgi:hypothetical protein
VRPDALRYAGPAHWVRDLALDRRLVQMKARGRPPSRIATDPRGGKHKLPGPLCGSVPILAIQGKGQNHTAETVGEIPFMLSSHLLQVFLEPRLDSNRQHRPTVLLAFTPANDNFMPVEIDILHSKLQTFLQPQPGSIKKRHDDPDHPFDVLEDLADFLSAEDDRTRCGILARGTWSIAPTSMQST